MWKGLYWDIQEKPRSSIRHKQAAIRTVSTTVWQALQRKLLYPYHLQQAQTLGLPDVHSYQEFVSAFFNSVVKIPSTAAMYSSLAKKASQRIAH
jgi:hypothetical protein